MLDIKFIRENPQKVQEACEKKNIDFDLGQLLRVDKKRRELIQAVEDMRAKKNRASEQIQRAKTQGEKDVIILEMQELDKNNDRLDANMKEVDMEFDNLISQVPNIPFDNVPVGKNDSENVPLEKVGKLKNFDFPAKDYMQLAANLDLIDTERAAKIAGSRFGFIKKEAALLELALIKFAFDTLGKKGFIPVIPPVMIRPEMAKGMGFLQQTNKEDAYYLQQDDLYLTATSEQSLGTMHAGEIFEEEDLPRRYAGFSTCFRREAGSYGKDTKGIFRVHQFDKIEMFSFTKPEESKKEHQLLLSIERSLMDVLKLPYQIVHICTGDLGTSAAEKYDIEGWLPSENRYRETHSTSNCTDFQSRSLNIRYQKKDGKTELIHTLNGTAFAIGRILIMIIENYQQKDGSVKIPDVLQKYVGTKEIKRK